MVPGKSIMSPNGRDDMVGPTIRCSPHLPWKRRGEVVESELSSFNPSWISLQFVPYGYHANGVVNGLAKVLAALMRSALCRRHIMFHEIWVGAKCSAPIRERLFGWVQRLAVGRLVRNFDPQCVNTHTPGYQSALRGLGVCAQLLPLFGNIPYRSTGAESWLFPVLNQRKIEINSGNRGRFWLFGMFGSLHREWPPEPLIPDIARMAKSRQIRAVILAFGHMGPGGPLWRTMEERYADSLDFISLGPMAEYRIAELINTVDCGIATSPLQLISKSGSAAAFLDFGVPLIVNRDDVRFKGSRSDDVTADPLLFRGIDMLEPDAFGKRNANRVRGDRLREIATRFLSQLETFG